MAKNFQRKATNKWAEEKPKLDAAREHRGIYSSLDDDPDYEEIMNNARRKLVSRRASAMHCKATKSANPNGSNWGDPMQVIGLRLKRKDWILHVQSKIMIT